MQQSLLYSILEHSHVIQVHKCCTKWETFRFAVPAWNLFTQDNKTKAWSHLSGGHVFGKVRVLTRSRNRCKLSLFRFHYSAWFFLCFSKHVTSLVIRKLSQRFTFTPNSKLNVNLYHVTKFPLIFRYFPFTLYCFYTKISQFYASCNQRNRTGLFFICLIWFWEILNLGLTFAVCGKRES